MIIFQIKPEAMMGFNISVLNNVRIVNWLVSVIFTMKEYKRLRIQDVSQDFGNWSLSPIK